MKYICIYKNVLFNFYFSKYSIFSLYRKIVWELHNFFDWKKWLKIVGDLHNFWRPDKLHRNRGRCHDWFMQLKSTKSTESGMISMWVVPINCEIVQGGGIVRLWEGRRERKGKWVEREGDSESCREKGRKRVVERRRLGYYWSTMSYANLTCSGILLQTWI